MAHNIKYEILFNLRDNIFGSCSTDSLAQDVGQHRHAPVKKIQLFDGKTLDGWSLFPEGTNAPAATIWSVTNGVIACLGKPNGYARTLQLYRDYRLHAEWRWPSGPGNSGIFLHVNPPDKVWPLCFEAQLQASLMRANCGLTAVLFSPS